MHIGESPKKEKAGSQRREGNLGKPEEFVSQAEHMSSVNHHMARIAKGNFL